MPLIRWLVSRVLQFLAGFAQQRRASLMAKEKEDGAFTSKSADDARNFEDDYRAATRMLKQRIDERFPDSYYARLSSKSNSSYDYGQDRAMAVDIMSTAIAAALRNGASVRQAADAGAASVGI